MPLNCGTRVAVVNDVTRSGRFFPPKNSATVTRRRLTGADFPPVLSGTKYPQIPVLSPAFAVSAEVQPFVKNKFSTKHAHFIVLCSARLFVTRCWFSETKMFLKNMKKSRVFFSRHFYDYSMVRVIEH